jgi:tetratricopeptide (TPR) repeat protein
LPQNAVALNRLGLAYQYVGRMEDARKQYLRALKADQNLFEAQHNLGILYFDTENWIEAERCLRIWLGRHPEDLEAWNRLGLAQFRNGAPLEAAEQSLSNVARANTKDPEVWNTLGLISLKRHKYKEAQQRFGYGLKLDPGNAALHLNLAVLLHQYLNDRRGAVPHYRTFLEINPNAPEAEAVRTLLLQLDPPAPPPRAEVTNLNTRTLVVAPVAATNPPAPVATRMPAVVPSNTPPAVVSPVYNNITTERRSAPEAVSAPVPILKSNPPAIRAAAMHCRSGVRAPFQA